MDPKNFDEVSAADNNANIFPASSTSTALLTNERKAEVIRPDIAPIETDANTIQEVLQNPAHNSRVNLNKIPRMTIEISDICRWIEKMGRNRKRHSPLTAYSRDMRYPYQDFGQFSGVLVMNKRLMSASPALHICVAREMIRRTMMIFRLFRNLGFVTTLSASFRLEGLNTSHNSHRLAVCKSSSVLFRSIVSSRRIMVKIIEIP